MSAAGQRYQQRLIVYVVWHPNFKEGPVIADGLYDLLTRDSQKPIARGLGIPVYFRSTPERPTAHTPRAIELDEAHHSAVVVLVDDVMVADYDDGWQAYVNQLAEQAAADPARHRVLPVKLSDLAFDFGGVGSDLGASNFIRPPVGDGSAWSARIVPPTMGPEKRPKLDVGEAYELYIPILHELCRLLLNKPRVDYDSTAYCAAIGEPVQVFLSHAKRTDGEAIAERFKTFLNDRTQLRSFFDTKDIPHGANFEKILKDGIDLKHAALLAIQTDEYCDREWCQREVLWAKKYERPVLVVHAVGSGEKCSFPYLGNTPTIRYDKASSPDLKVILGQLLVEVLRNVHFRDHFDDLRPRLGLVGDLSVRVLSQAPELITLLELSADQVVPVKLVVYPDPPLGEHLRDVLHRFASGLEVTTPILLATSGRRADGGGWRLDEVVVGLSIGDSPDLARLGFSNAHVTDAAVEFARYLLEAGAILAYGGDLSPGGHTETLRDLVWTYKATPEPGKSPERLLGYLAWPIHLDKFQGNPAYNKWRDPSNRIKFEPVPRPPDQLAAAPPRDVTDPALKTLTRDQRFAALTAADLLIWARSLTAMREAMNARINARVLLGGRVVGYSGRYPGLVEEALLAKRSNKPMYLLGGFGGCVAALIAALLRLDDPALAATFDPADGSAPALSEAVQYRHAPYAEMVALHNAIPGVDLVDYPKLTAELAAWGLAGLSASNGLTPDENLRLFQTPHSDEMIALVLSGLMRKTQT